MRGQLSTRLIILVGIPATLLFALVVWSASLRGFNRVVHQAEASSRTTARYYAARIEGVLHHVTNIPQMMRLNLESRDFSGEAQLEAYLREVVATNPEIYGSCIAFEPNSFIAEKLYYAPYFYRKDGAPEFVQLGNPEYDYFKWDWYRQPKEVGQALWSEPYFDDGGGNAIMTTYSVPFSREGKFWGIATIDIAMNQLITLTESIVAGKSGYAFIVSRQGRLLAYPEKERVMRDTIGQLSPELSQHMLAGEDGFLRTVDPLRGEEAWITFVPINEGGLSLAIVHPQAELMAEAFDLQKELIALGVIGLLALFVALTFIARSISRPISALAQAAQDVAAGQFDLRLDASGATDEVRSLTFAFNKMTRDLQMRMQELRYTTTVRERLEGELAGARSIQMSLLPKVFPAFPDRREFDIHAIVRPAREVGGDFYDFYFLDDDHLCLLLGDVSGKGIPAALYMAVTKTLLKATSCSTLTAGEIVAKVNNELCEDSDTGMFVTLLYAILHTGTGEVQFSNAGHHPPFLLRASGGVAPLEGESGVALGLLPGLEYPVVKTQLAPGDTLFLYTDGVTEALNAEREFYAPARLQMLLREVQEQPVDRITRAVTREVRTFSGEREQTDDISVLALRWMGKEAATEPTLLRNAAAAHQ
jgi:sigma-B regulation protein RsbU (phosphoserine phosphatase)